MKVKDMIELLLQQPQNADVLIDCRDTDNISIYTQDGWYQYNKYEIVVHIET